MPSTGTQQHELLALGDHYLGEGVHAILLHAAHQQAVGFLAHRTVGQQVVGAAGVIDRIDLFRSHESLDVDAPVALGAQLVELVVVDHHVLALGMLVAADDLIAAHLAVLRAHFLVGDAAVALAVQLIEPDLAAGRVGGIRLDRHRYQAELNESLPIGTWRHGFLRLDLLHRTLLARSMGCQGRQGRLAGGIPR